MNCVTHPHSSTDFSNFLQELKKFCYIKKYRMHFGTNFLIALTFFEFSYIILKNIITILMMSAKSLL